MPDQINGSHPHHALLEYARDMHQYTLELWLELSKKLDASGNGPQVVQPEHGPSKDAAQSDQTNSDIDAESPQEFLRPGVPAFFSVQYTVPASSYAFDGFFDRRSR
ncbi:hypothetical protein C8Q79DRAFT_1008159 [Trametes meyenii]|nr:hypothetical protein C8Q79DRAFT_1008159 [Trametes meyenii]